VLDQVYLGRDGTGMLITLDNLDAVMETQQRIKTQFHRKNPEEIKRMHSVFRRVSKSSGTANMEQP
jgi:hypothetical protein